MVHACFTLESRVSCRSERELDCGGEQGKNNQRGKRELQGPVFSEQWPICLVADGGELAFSFEQARKGGVIVDLVKGWFFLLGESVGRERGSVPGIVVLKARVPQHLQQ